MGKKLKNPHLLAIPFPAIGNILPLVDLAHDLSTRGISVTIAVTAGNFPQFQHLLSSSPATLHLLPIPLPFQSRAEDLPPSRFLDLSDTLAALHAPLLLWSVTHHSPPTALLSDFLLPWSHRLASDLSIPHYVFCPFSALSVSIARFFHRRKGVVESESDAEISIHGLPRHHIFPLITAASNEYDSAAIRSRGFVFNSFSALEPSSLRHVSAARIWAVGPISHRVIRQPGQSSITTADLTEWLETCPDCSVAYISLGQRTVLAPPQAAAVGKALKLSNVRFVWCVKGPEVEKGLNCEVPAWVEEAAVGTERKGVVVEGWVAQAEVLKHRAVGAIVTHCGWNSVMEAIVAGVPMVAWPMAADQYVNARLVAGAGLGVGVCEGGEAVPDAVDLAAKLADSVGCEGRGRREKAAEMRRMAAAAVEEGGSSGRDMEALLEELRSGDELGDERENGTRNLQK